MHSLTICPVCKKQGNTPKYQFGKYNIVTCANCHQMHLSPIPTFEELEQIYNSDYYSDKEDDKGYLDYGNQKDEYHKTYKNRFLKVKNFLAKKEGFNFTRAHEIGCALGHGIGAIKEEFQAEVSASDISQEIKEKAENLGCDFYLADKYGRCELEQGSVDIVLAFDLIEHLPDIPVFREWLNETLTENGYFLLATPDFSSIYNKILGKRSPSILLPEHLLYFTSNSLKKALEPEFELVKRWPDYQMIPFYVLLNKVSGILGMGELGRVKNSILNLPIWVPNGMGLFLFKKRERA